MHAGRFNDWRLTMEVLTLLLIIAVVAYAIGGCLPGKDYRRAAEQGRLLADKVAPELEADSESLLRGESHGRDSQLRYVMFCISK
jgi:hypothetical protein